MTQSESFQLGWEEWLSLPDLGLPAIKAKIDTGARTSALHASVIEPFGPADAPQVRFLIQPDPSDPGLEITCSAPVVDRRDVTSSNGETELRYVIQTDVEIGGRRWPIQLTLTNRESMTYRMLFGRGAIQPDMIVNANASFLQPKLDFAAYAGLPKKRPVKRPLRIALLTREPRNYSSRRLIEAAQERGHVIEAIDTARCYMQIGTTHPQVHYDGKALPRYDAVIPRIGAGITGYGLAVLRQFTNTGAFCLNSASAIGHSRDKLMAHQLLARAKIDMPVTAFAHSPKDTKDLISLAGGAPVVVKLLSSTQGKGVVLAETRKAAESLTDAFRGLDANFLVQEFVEEAAGTDVRAFVIGNKVVGAMNGSAVLFYGFAVANWTLGMQLGFEAQYNAWPYHTALTLGLILVAVQLLLIRTGWNKLVAGVGTPEAESGRKRLAAGLGIGNLVWLVLFILMYVGRGVVGG